MPASRSSVRRPANRDITINIRARSADRALLDRASAALGQSRSDFMLEAARREAKSVLLDQTLFALDAPAWKRFMKALDAPPRPTAGLNDLMKKRSPWER